MLFYRKRKQERHSNTAPYLHCGMVIFVVILINTWGIYYSENSVNSKQCQRCLQQVKTGGSWSRLIIQTLTRPQLSLIICKRSRNGHVRLLRQLLRRASHHPPHFLWPRVSRYHNWERVSYKPWILQFTLLWRHWTTATNGSLRQTITDTVSTSVIYYLLAHRFAIRTSLPSYVFGVVY